MWDNGVRVIGVINIEKCIKCVMDFLLFDREYQVTEGKGGDDYGYCSIISSIE